MYEAFDYFRKVSGEDKLYELPDNINVKSNITKSEEMLSSQMLSGIPEVDLGESALNKLPMKFLKIFCRRC